MYHLAKYLAQLLNPLSESRYTVKNTKEFTKKNRKQKIPKHYTVVPCDVASLFTNVPLENTINIILRRIYKKKEIVTDIPKRKMCTLNSTTKVKVKDSKSLKWTMMKVVTDSIGQCYPAMVIRNPFFKINGKVCYKATPKEVNITDNVHWKETKHPI